MDAISNGNQFCIGLILEEHSNINKLMRSGALGKKSDWNHRCPAF